LGKLARIDRLVNHCYGIQQAAEKSRLNTVRLSAVLILGLVYLGGCC
jgi:hypothetical protein